MKRLLLGSSALLGAAALLGAPGLVGTARAAEPIKLSVGGFFKEAYMVVIDSDDDADNPLFAQSGNEQNTDGFFNDAEVHFTGSTVLDNGLEVGARIELEGETDGDQIDEAWVWFSGGFGEVRIGSDDDALANSCVVPPGGTGNFSAFSPNQWGANSTKLISHSLDAEILGSNSVCTGVDGAGDAQKIIFITPNFGGFQLTASYTPSEFRENHQFGGGPHVGMPDHSTFTESRHNASVYATYTYDGADWGLTAGLGGSWEGHREQGSSTAGNVAEQDFYQAGLNLRFGNFGIGAAGEYYSDMLTISFPGGLQADLDIWVAGIGASYAVDAWTFGLQYSHRHDDEDTNSFVGSFDIDVDRVVATANYALGPGINIDGELGYTWVDFDDELEDLNPGLPDNFDDYQGFEIGIGTSITF